MIKDLSKHIKSAPFIISIVLPIALNISNMICMLHFFSGYRGFSERIVDNVLSFKFFLANWPSILFKIFPHTLGQSGEIEYEFFSVFDIKILAVDILGWGLLGLLCSFLIKKYRKPARQSSDST